MRRVVVIGCPGSGKTTLARDLADRLGLDHIELDSLWHLPSWEHRPTEEFRDLFQTRLDDAGDGWVTCGNFNDASGGIHLDPARTNTADTIVWLDLPRHVVMARVVRRTLRRVITREELWNGLREPWSNLWSPDPERNIIRWAWDHHPIYRARYEESNTDGSWSHLEVHRLANRSHVETFRNGIAPLSR